RIMTRTELLLRVQDLRSARTPFVLATVVRAQRPTSAKAGDCAVVLPDGTIDGFVGGTCAESTVRVQGLRLLETGESTLLRITPEPTEVDPAGGEAPDGVVAVANPCLSGGALDIFLEAMLPAPLVLVLGDGPVARALAGVGTAAGYEMRTVADPAALPPPDATGVVVASHGRDEQAALTAALRAGVPYVALVASRRRAAAVLAGLDVSDVERARVHSPAGLDIGARTAPEVALSILAELVSLRPAAPRQPRPSTMPSTVEPAATPATDATVARDPVCGMEVAVVPSALRVEHGGAPHYFCGSGCRTAFLDHPERYAG
ncbi:MAG: XdhC family protein, partial [Micromonosporaceae bacterium]|nr:XdhC family protein [Micromonosporaceae bacterium]